MGSQIVAVINGKGGVGKTTLAATLAVLFADAGQRVLAIDLDPQGSMTETLGMLGGEHDDGGEALARTMRGSSALRPVPTGRERLHLAPGGGHLRPLVDSGAPMPTFAWDTLARMVDPNGWDWIFIDTPPALGEADLQINALVAARWAIIPVAGDLSSRKGMRAVAERFGTARSLNPRLELLGVVTFGIPTGATRVRADLARAIHADFGGNAPLFTTTIRHSASAAKLARDEGMTAPELAGARKRQVLETIIALTEKREVGPAWPPTVDKLATDYLTLAHEIDERIAERTREAANV